MRVQQLIEDDLNKRSAKHTNKSKLVARGAHAQQGSSCVSAPLATNVYLWKLIALATLDALCWIMFVVVSPMVSMPNRSCSVSNMFLNSSWYSIFLDPIRLASTFGHNVFYFRPLHPVCS